MRKLHITFSDDNMTKSAILSRDSALKHGADYSIMVNNKCYDSIFYKLNKSILQQDRGAGYWLWKPYIIYNNLCELNDNDILIYTDAGVEIINNLNYIIDRMDSDIFLFGNNYRHLDWCKIDVMNTIYPNWAAKFNRDSRQIQASAIFIRNTEAARLFIGKWLKYCQLDGFIDDSQSLLYNYPSFQEHRHDQAILTCLAYYHNIKLHYWPAQYNNGQFIYDKHAQYKDDIYPIIFHHHRKRNSEW
jgi:hypothetical protein